MWVVDQIPENGRHLKVYTNKEGSVVLEDCESASVLKRQFTLDFKSRTTEPILP